jgi:hypothetical protein
VRTLGIEHMSKSQVSELVQSLDASGGLAVTQDGIGNGVVVVDRSPVERAEQRRNGRTASKSTGMRRPSSPLGDRGSGSRDHVAADVPPPDP